MSGKHTTKVQVAKFARAFVKNGGNATAAMMETKPALTYDSARSAVHRMLRREDIIAAITEALESTEIDYKFVLNARKQFIAKGLDQLNGKKKDNEPFVSPSDVSKHLQGIEGVYKRLEELSIAPNSSSSSKHLHLHLEGKTPIELVQERNKSAQFFNEILDSED